MIVDWANPADIGYPVLFGGVLLGSVVPVVPTGAVVGAAAAIATSTDRLNIVAVVVVAALGSLLGDLITFAAARGGRTAVVRWFSRRQSEERLAAARDRFARRGWQVVVVGRMVPAGRIPVLLAAGALDYPWRRLVPAAAGACLLWSVAYSALGVVSGGLFDHPVVATVIATLLVLVVTAVSALVARQRERRRAGQDVS
jgi:membrane protein DedA with SNARE-associated domain